MCATHTNSGAKVLKNNDIHKFFYKYSRKNKKMKIFCVNFS